MTARWTIRNLIRTPSWIVAGIFYALGFAVVSIPTLITFCNVLGVIAARGAEWLQRT